MNITEYTHRELERYIQKDDICIDATAGNGSDTLFLCRLGANVWAFDIQDIAVERTKKLLSENGFSANVIKANHKDINKYFDENSVSCIMFNLGYLPKGDHSIATRPDTTISALSHALKLIKKGGIISVMIYSGGESGFEEKDKVLDFLSGIDDKAYDVIVSMYYNRRNNPPIPAFIIKR